MCAFYLADEAKVNAWMMSESLVSPPLTPVDPQSDGRARALMRCHATCRSMASFADPPIVYWWSVLSYTKFTGCCTCG